MCSKSKLNLQIFCCCAECVPWSKKSPHPTPEQSSALDLDLGLRVCICNTPRKWIILHSFPELQLTHACRHEIVELLDVHWLEIKGAVDARCLLKMTCYSAYLVFKLKPTTQCLDTALASVRYIKDKGSYSQNRRCQVFLAKTKSSGDPGQFPSSRPDGWMEIKLGDFYISSGNESALEMRLWNTENMYGKSGLIVRGIDVRPRWGRKFNFILWPGSDNNWKYVQF